MRAECVRYKILDKMSKMVKERCFILLRPTILANFVIFLQFFFSMEVAKQLCISRMTTINWF